MGSPAFIRLLCIAAGFTAVATSSLRAAAPYIETFSTGMNGWTNLSGSVWRTNSGSARVSISSSPAPANSTLTATGAQLTAAFTGDYAAAETRFIGFKFRADTVLPDTINFRLISGLNGYFRNDLALLVTETNVWYQFVFSLASKSASAWGGDDESLFETVLSNITRVDLYVQRPAFEVGVFRVDDIVLDRLPAATALASGSSSNMTLTGDFLQTNVTYLIEATPDLTGVWTVVQSVLATNRLMSISLTNNGSQLFWRLAIP